MNKKILITCHGLLFLISFSNFAGLDKEALENKQKNFYHDKNAAIAMQIAGGLAAVCIGSCLYTHSNNNTLLYDRAIAIGLGILGSAGIMAGVGTAVPDNYPKVKSIFCNSTGVPIIVGSVPLGIGLFGRISHSVMQAFIEKNVFKIAGAIFGCTSCVGLTCAIPTALKKSLADTVDKQKNSNKKK